MKKSLIAALTGALVVGATATTFAAANPFSDVPAGHWAYDSVTKLAAEGVIEGYGDGTYRGNRNITRYEMAQMVARALARYPQGSTSSSNINAATRAELNKLAAEFRDELDSLGVRVDELEKHADMVKWTGKIEYTYGDRRTKEDGTKFSTGATHNAVFRLEPSAYVNEHWTANARFDANVDFGADETQDVKLKRIFAKGDYDKFSITLGRFGYCPAIEDGIVADTVLSGGEISFGSKWKFTVDAGRVGADSDEAHFNGLNIGKFLDERTIEATKNKTEFVSGHISYNPGDVGLYGQASYYYAKDNDFTLGQLIDASDHKSWDLYSNDGTNKASVWALGLGYKVSDMLNIHGAYAKNSKADYQDYGWDALAYFGNYADAGEQGQWAIWGGYSRFGSGVALASSQGDDVPTGAKGWHVGAAYAPLKHFGVLARYSDGKWLNDGDKYKKVFGRLEFFF